MTASKQEITYPLRAAARLTGLSPELLRAWERRYGAVSPQRTSGGTRRYRAADVERLRRLKAAVDAGHRIGEVAELDDATLARLAEPEPGASGGSFGIDALVEAAQRLDAQEVRRLMAMHLAALGPARFARDVAIPLAQRIGDLWAEGRLSIASEHLASAWLRSMLGSALAPGEAASRGPRIVFATLSGERHELGLQAAALIAMGAGAHPIYLGAELPIDDLLAAVEEVDAQVLALAVVGRSGEATRSTLAALRAGLPDRVRLWVGGAGSEGLDALDGVERMGRLEELEQRVGLLDYEAA